MQETNIPSRNILNPIEYTPGTAGYLQSINRLHYKLLKHLLHEKKRKKWNIIDKCLAQHSLYWEGGNPDFVGMGKRFYFDDDRLEKYTIRMFGLLENKKWFSDNKQILDLISEKFPELLI